MQNKYSYYHAKDYVNDAYFWSWVTAPNAESNTYWENYINANPSKKQAVEEAREIIENLERPQFSLTKERTEHLWHEIRKNTADVSEEHRQTNMLPAAASRQASLKVWYSMAAVFIGVLVMAFVYHYIRQEDFLTVSTSIAQTREVLLPDSSEVILNADSRIRYKKNWDKGEREIWIQGEAFFTVRHLQNDKKFTVYANGIKVEVLGTEFMVNNRKEKTKVILNSGKVNLVMEGTAKAPQEMEMKPGDLVEYSATRASLDQKVVNPDTYLSWINNELAFEETSLQEMISILEDHYGYTIRTNLKDDKILNKKFTGTVPVAQINIMLAGLSRSHNLDIRKKGTVITIDSPGQEQK